VPESVACGTWTIELVLAILKMLFSFLKKLYEYNEGSIEKVLQGGRNSLTGFYREHYLREHYK
jgi:hypothetical protein